MLTPKQFAQLKEKADRENREAERAQGRLDQLLSELKREHGAGTLEEAKTLAAEAEKEASRLEKVAEKVEAAFMAEHGERLLGDGA